MLEGTFVLKTIRFVPWNFRSRYPGPFLSRTPIFTPTPTAGARSPISPKLCMLVENVVTILKCVNHFSIQRIVFPAGAKMLIFGH